MKKVVLLIFLSIFLVSCQSTKSISVSEIIPEDCTNTHIFLKDHRLGNYNKQEYYYLDDIDEIKIIFSEWTDLKKIPVFPRYFDSGFSCEFEFYLIVDGKIQSCPINGISPDGKMLEINGQGYEYNIEYWERLKSKLKPAKKEEAIICKNANEYRKKLDEIKKDKDYLFSEVNFTEATQSIPEQYDGFFYITTNNLSWSNVTNKIKKVYPDESFEIGAQRGGGLFRSCDYQIYASKDFYEKFDLYPKNEYIEFGEKKDIKLTVYRKE